MIIEFNGEISEKNQLDRSKRVDMVTIISFLIAMIFVAIVGIGVALIFDFLSEIWIDLVVCEIVCILVIIMIRFTPKSIRLRFRLSSHIIITEEELSMKLWTMKLWSGYEKVWRKKISRVKKILDYGEVYYIIFRFGDITNSWICQKDNIVNGSIEEFENLFQSKIIRKTK